MITVGGVKLRLIIRAIALLVALVFYSFPVDTFHVAFAWLLWAFLCWSWLGLAVKGHDDAGS